MNRTEYLLSQARTAQIERASQLQAGLGAVLRRLDEPQYARIRAGLKELKARHMALLDEGIAAGILTESDYRRLMADYIDEIDLSQLLAALS